MTTSTFAAGAYSAIQGLSAPTAARKPAATGAGDFGSMLMGAVNGVSATGGRAEAQTLQAASGRANMVDVVTAVAESEAAMETLVAVRDKVIAAYEDIMRMPI